MRRLRKFLALAPAERAILLRSLLLLPLVAVSLQLRGLARTKAALARAAAGDTGALTPREKANLVDAAASFLHLTCLPRTLVLWHLLRNHDGSAEIRLGVAKSMDGRLSAHAWLELGGVPLNDCVDVCAHYTPLPARAN